MARKKKKLTKKQLETRKRIVFSIFTVVLIFILGYSTGKNGLNKEKWSETLSRIESKLDDLVGKDKKEKNEISIGPATVRVLDVGQGSATLLQSEDGTNILIDSGRDDDKDKRIMQYLDKYIGTGGTIDLLVFTHNHADHLGFGDQILSYYKVNEVWMNGVDTTTKVYERVLDAIATSNALYKEPLAGESVEVGPFQLDVLHPFEEKSTDQNEESIAVKASINQFSLMITGDAGKSVEKEIIKKFDSLRSTILVLGHHGSKYSTDEIWLKTVQPEAAIYSSGEGNVYGHPAPEAVSRVEQQNIPLYGTDKNGSVTFLINQDGTYRIQVEKGGENDEDGAGRN